MDSVTRYSTTFLGGCRCDYVKDEESGSVCGKPATLRRVDGSGEFACKTFACAEHESDLREWESE